ncbi:MAG TPA: PAC2 family protein [Acidimicrobiales bacterium]|nr:PAC2 family protein [Acidimicrobiales bacterium]
MEPVRWDDHPRLRRPVLLAAFEGWNDAGDAASMAARWLAAQWAARGFATIDPEEFYDFTVARPRVRLVEGMTRKLEWPDGELEAASPPGSPHDVVFLHAAEPQLRWRTYAATVVDIARSLEVELAITLGGLGAEVPHTRPVRVTGTAANAALASTLGLRRSRYEGPTGIVGVLHDAFGRAGIPSASLWANVPHYVSGAPSPKAALALVERTTNLLGARVPLDELRVAAEAYERQVSEVVAEDDEVAASVRRLEELEELDVDADEGLEPSGGLAEEVEQFLRDQSAE